MKKTLTQKQIVSMVRQPEGGTPVAEIYRKLGITEQTICHPKRKFSGCLVHTYPSYCTQFMAYF